MHPLFQALCLIICSEILPYSNKLLFLTLFLAKSLPWLFLQEIKSGKNTTSFLWKRRWTRGGAGGPKGVAPRGPCTWPRAPPQMGLGHRLASGLRRMPSYMRKNTCPRRRGGFAKHTAATITIFVSGDRSIQNSPPVEGSRGRLHRHHHRLHLHQP